MTRPYRDRSSNPSTNFQSTPFKLLDAVGYLDTLELWVFRRLPDGLLSSLRTEYGGRFRFEPLWKSATGCVVRSKITIHQPTTATLAAFDALRPRSFTVHRVDIASDFVTATHDEARLVQEYVDKHVIQKWRRRQHQRHVVVTTSYWKRPGSQRNIALYSDLISKVTLGPCCHLEMRFTGTRTCRAAGLSDLAMLATGIDVQALLKRQAKIAILA